MGRYAVLAALAVLGALPDAGAFAEGVVTILPTNAQVKADSAARVGITVRVKPGFHVQANPVENPSLIPITFKIDPAAGVTVGKPLYPVAKRIRLQGDDHDLVVYDGTFTIALPLTLSRDFAPGDNVKLNGSLRYQACDERHCLFPVTVPLALAVNVKPAPRLHMRVPDAP